MFYRPLRGTPMGDRATICAFYGAGAEVALARLSRAVERHSDRTGNR